jgi:transposase
VAIEAGREAWAAHAQLTEWGNDVLLVDTTRSRQRGTGQRRRKHDGIDAESLARALERGHLPVAHLLRAEEPVVNQLMTAPGVGPMVAASFVSVLDDAKRFRGGHHLESYLGLVPGEDTTGRKRRQGAITKQGNGYLRALLIQSSWSILRTAPKDDPLRRWAETIARRRGKRIAVIALARRLAGVLWAMWRNGTLYDAAFAVPVNVSPDR